MPPLIAAATAFVVAIFTPVVGATLAASIGTFVVQLAVSAVISAAIGALTPKPKSMDQGTQLATKYDPAFKREVCVGHYATGGSLAFENTNSTKNLYLWRVIIISDAEIQTDTIVLNDGEQLTFSGDIHTGLRECTSHFRNTRFSTNQLSVRIHTGTQTQTADADLLAAFPSLLDSNFRLRGMAYAVIRMTYDTEAWQGGFNPVFAGSGAPVYDPRTAASVFSENPVLIGRQFLKGFTNNGIRVVGLGVADADLPDADYIDGADDCDELITLLAGGTEKRYRMGGVISGASTARDVLADICAVMAGKHIDRGGEIVLLPGVARASVMTIDESDLLADGAISFAAKRTADERINAIVSTYVSPTNGYQEAPLPPRKDAAAITADGDRFETNYAYRFCYSFSQGQRLDQIALRAARKEGALQVLAPLWAFELTPGDNVTMTSARWGGTAKLWNVDTVQIAIVNARAGGAPQARCLLSMRETASTVFDWNYAADEIAPASSTALTRPGSPGTITDGQGRIQTVDGLPFGVLGGTGLVRDVEPPLSSPSSSEIDVAAHNASYVGGVTYAIPSAAITGLATDTKYWVFYRLSTAAFVTTTSLLTAATYYLDASDYIPCGIQRTQTGGGTFTPPPPPPPGGGGGGGAGGGGANYVV